jgi:hypothetical protein
MVDLPPAAAASSPPAKASIRDLLVAARTILPPDVPVVAEAFTLRRAVLDIVATPARAALLADTLARALAVPVEVRSGPWRGHGIPEGDPTDAGRVRLRLGEPPASDVADPSDPVLALALLTPEGLTARGAVVAAALARLASEALALEPVAGALAAARALGLVEVEVWLRGAAPAPLLDAARAAGRPIGHDPDAPRGAPWQATFTARDALGRTGPLLEASAAGVAPRGLLAAGPAAVLAAVEHARGALPAWLAPEPVVVLPVGPADVAAARAAARALGATIAPTIPDDAEAPLARRLAAAAALRPPYVAIVGPAEREAGTVALRGRGSTACATVEVDALRARLADEVATRAWNTQGAAHAPRSSTRLPPGESPTTNGG